MHDHGPFFLWPMFWALFGLAFWLIPTILRHRARMKALEVSQRLLEKGVTPPPEMMEALRPRMRRGCTPWDDLRSGLILIAVAVGLVALGVVVQLDDAARGHAVGMHPLFGVAVFPGLIGLVLLGLSRFGSRRSDP